MNEEFRQIVEDEGGPHTITQAEYDRVAANFREPELDLSPANAEAETLELLRTAASDDRDFGRWLTSNVLPHRHPQLRAVMLSFKRLGYAPGDATAEQMEAAAELADRFSGGEARVTHEQNLLLPWVPRPVARAVPGRQGTGPGQAQHRPADRHDCLPRRRLLLAGQRAQPADCRSHHRALPGPGRAVGPGRIDLHISGCINSCGHHHSGHIGILGVDKDGKEWYQITLGGADGSDLSGPATPGKIIGPRSAPPKCRA